MIGIQNYTFLIGTKIRYPEWPALVQEYMKRQGLHYERFLYYFEDMFTACHKATADYPRLGPVRTRQTKACERNYLTNIGGDGCTEAEIMALMPKIYRRYGFSDSYLIYQGVDFFSRRIPSVVRAPGTSLSDLRGPDIRLYRDAVFPRWSSITLSIVTDDGSGEILDPSPYLHAMQELLPGFKFIGSVECFLSDEEKDMYGALDKSAAPLLENAREFFSARLKSSRVRPIAAPKLSAAQALKRLCAQYGYTYVKSDYSVYFLYKCTANGHYLLPEISVGPTFKEVGVSLNYAGAGFNHRIGHAARYPEDQAGLVSFLTECFEVLSSAEKEVFPALDAHYPPSPGWYVPVT